DLAAMAPPTPGPGSRTRDNVTRPGTTVTGCVTPGTWGYFALKRSSQRHPEPPSWARSRLVSGPTGEGAGAAPPMDKRGRPRRPTDEGPAPPSQPEVLLAFFDRAFDRAVLPLAFAAARRWVPVVAVAAAAAAFGSLPPLPNAPAALPAF